MVTYPKDWKLVRLGNVADVTKLAGFEFTAHVVYSDFGNIIAIRGLNVKNGKLIIDDVKYIDDSNFSKLTRSKLYKNDLLFTYVGTVGEVAIIPENEKYYLAPNVARIRLHNECFPQYMAYYMLYHKFYQTVIFPLIATSSQPALSMQNIRKFVIHLPSLPEQKTIAATLSALDTHIDNLTALIEKKQAIRDSALADLISGRTRLEGFSGEWEEKTIGYYVEVLQGGTPSTNEETYWNGQIVWITPGEITKLKGLYVSESERKISESGLNNSAATLLPIGTILLCTRATIGELGIANVPLSTNQGFKNLICKENANNIFLAYLLKTKKDILVEKSKGTTFLELSKKDLLKIVIKMPHIDEQKAIADILTSMDTEIQNLETERDKFMQIREGAMDELLTGRVQLPLEE